MHYDNCSISSLFICQETLCTRLETMEKRHITPHESVHQICSSVSKWKWMHRSFACTKIALWISLWEVLDNPHDGLQNEQIFRLMKAQLLRKMLWNLCLSWVLQLEQCWWTIEMVSDQVTCSSWASFSVLAHLDVICDVYSLVHNKQKRKHNKTRV